MNYRILAFLLVFASPICLADTWSTYVTISSIQPLTEWSGGAIRIQPATETNPAGCASTVYHDFTYDSGTEESRSAVVAAMYTAFTTGKRIKFFIDSDECSPANAPVIRGAYELP
jgi:hypothetical protein